MILCVAPEPPPWLPALTVDADEVVLVTVPAVVRKAVTAWTRGRADRRLAARFALRRLADRRARRRLTDATVAVHAASGCAQWTFAAARRREQPIRCMLVEDLPDLRRLHADLDRAAVAHPDARFLRRYRARRSEIVRQRAERVLADTIVVRGAFARQCRLEDGIDPARVGPVGSAPTTPMRAVRDPRRPVLLLAGLAAARSGLHEALDVLASIPGAELVLRVGEGLEPADALDRPGARVGTRAELEDLEGIDVVLAPSWCEAELTQLGRAASLGIPIVATDRVGGELEPGDAAGLARAVAAIVTG